MVCEWWRVKQKSIGSVSPHAWQLPVLLNLWLTVIATALAIAVHKRTENGTSLVPFTAATLVVLLCPLSLVWLKLAARYWKPSKAVSKQSRPPPLDGGSRGPPKQKSRTAVLVLCSSEKHSSPRCKVVKTVVCVLVILGVLFLLLLLAGDVERNPGPLHRPTHDSESSDSDEFFDAFENVESIAVSTAVTMDKVDHLAAVLEEIAADWYLFLGQLGVSDGTRSQILQQSIGQPNMAQYCLTRGLHHWVVSDESPTYEKITAVFNGDFLAKRPLARKVEEFAVQALTAQQRCEHSFTQEDAPPTKRIRLTACSEATVQYRTYLQEYYKAQTLAPAGDTKWPPTPSKHYINLAYISKEGTTRKQAYEFTRSTIEGDVDDILREKKPMSMRDIAKLQPDRSYPKLVLVEGAPGVGKTTFSWELCRRWAEGELMQHYSLVIVLRCRDKRVREAKTIDDLLYHPDSDVQQAAMKEIKQSLGEHVLFLLEGYDELPGQLREQHDSVFSDFISGRSLPRATVLVTSRPSATGNLRLMQCQRMTQHIEILGFTKKQLQFYLKSCMSETEVLAKLQHYLKLRPQIQAAMYIPLNAAIVVRVYQESDELPETMTELYKSLGKSILIRYQLGGSGSSSVPRGIKDFSDLPKQTLEQFLGLCKLAYDGICNNQQLIFTDLPEDFETLGFMQSVAELYVSQGASISYNFLHLTIQEFLAAYHIFEQPPDQWTAHFEKYQEKSHFKVTLRFLAGLTELKGVPLPIVNDLYENRFFKISAAAVTLYKHCFSGSDVPEIDLDTVHWLFEAHNPIAVELNTNVHFTLELCKMPLDFYALGYCLRNYASWNLDIGDKAISEYDLELLSLGYTYSASNSKELGEGVTCAMQTQRRPTSNMLRQLLTIFSLKNLQIHHVNEEELQLLSKHNLEVLKVNRSCAVDFNEVLTMVSKSSTLKLLDLSHIILSQHPSLENPDTSPSNVARLISILEQNQPPLTGLYLHDCAIMHQQIAGAKESIQLLHALPSRITHLDLSFNPIGKKGVTVLAGKIAQGSLHLTELNLARCGIDEDGGAGAVELIEALNTSVQTISKLNLSWNPIGDTLASSLAKLLQNSSSTLTDLTLYNCYTPPQSGAVMTITSALRSNTTLRTLEMSHSRWNAGMLADLLQHNVGLAHLILHHCHIRVKDPEQLLNYLCLNTKSKLEVLDVRHKPNQVTSDIPEDLCRSYKPNSLRKLLYDTVTNNKETMRSVTYCHAVIWRNQAFVRKTTEKVGSGAYYPQQ